MNDGFYNWDFKYSAGSFERPLGKMCKLELSNWPLYSEALTQYHKCIDGIMITKSQSDINNYTIKISWRIAHNFISAN